MDNHFSRSLALNNIPPLKLLEKINATIRTCETCSKKIFDVSQGIDGACRKCSLISLAYQRYNEANIPIEYWLLKMERDFKGDAKLLEKYKEYTADLKSSYLNGTSLIFAGSHGLGKTFATSCILKKAAGQGYNCLYTTLSDIVNVLISAPFEERYAARRELLLSDFLVIDEFDSRFFSTDNAADLYARTLEGVFRIRAQNKLPTLLCTNSPNMIETFHGPLKQSISSLMQGYLKTVIVLGEDFRKTKE